MEELKSILWRVFVASNVKRNPNDPECMRNRDFVEVISKDIKLPTSLCPMRADLEVMHTYEAAEHPKKKFSFSCFINCVVKIATKKKSSTKTPQQQVDFLVKKYFAPLADKRKTRGFEDEIFILEPMAEGFGVALKECFMFFATIPTDYETKTLHRHEPRPDINTMTQSLHFGEWLSLCSLFNLSSSIGAAVKALTPSQLAAAFMDSSEVARVDSMGGLNYEEFWQALVRCSLFFNKGDESMANAGIKDKVVKTFAHMSNNLETAVPRLLKLGNITESSGVMAGLTSGGRDASTAGGLLQSGTKEFTKLIWAELRKNVEVVDEKERAFDETTIKEKVWSIFIKCNVTNNPRDWSNMRKRELVLLIRGRKPALRIMEADVNVIHQQEAGRNKGRRLEFTNFLAALRSIAKKAFPKEGKKGEDEAVTKLLKEYLLKDEELLHASLWIDDEAGDLAAFLKHFEPGLKKIFQFFATNVTEEEKAMERHLEMEDGINQQTASMKWPNFLDFAAATNLSSGTGAALTALSLSELAAAFVDSIDIQMVDNIGGLYFSEFLNVIIRCALVFKFQEAGTDRIKLEKLLLHMNNNLQTSVPRIINSGNERVGKGGQTAGGRAHSTSHGLLIRGTREFNTALSTHVKYVNKEEVKESIFNFAASRGGDDDELAGLTASLRQGL